MIQIHNEDSEGERSLPEFKEWSIASVRLLQGVVYSDDDCWEVLLRSQKAMESYFARLGLIVVLDEAEGLAFLRQMTDQEGGEDYGRIPKLFRKTKLGFETSLLCVLLRDALRRYEEEDLDNQKCVILIDNLFDHWKSFYPSGSDEVQLRRSLEKGLRKLEEMKFVRRFGDDAQAWEIRRILKARLPVQELENLRDRLSNALQATGSVEARGEA